MKSFLTAASARLLLVAIALTPAHHNGAEGLEATEDQCFQLAWDLAAASPKTVSVPPASIQMYAGSEGASQKKGTNPTFTS